MDATGSRHRDRRLRLRSSGLAHIDYRPMRFEHGFSSRTGVLRSATRATRSTDSE
jgi:hypothetical protein